LKSGIRLIKALVLFGMVVSAATTKIQAQDTMPPIGKWRIHASYKVSRVCEASGPYVYAASAGGIFRTDIRDGEMKTLTRLDGFQASGVSTMRYAADLKILIIGYNNGMIELLKNDRTLTQINGFYSKLIQGDKRIIHINVVQNKAIISTTFGILVLDLIKEEISDSYTAIGPGGQSLGVLATAVSGDSIYAGTNTGIIRAKYAASVNLNDYNNWKQVFNGNFCTQLHAFNDSLYFASDSVVYRMYRGITRVVIAEKNNTGRIQQYEEKLNIFRGGGIFTVTASGLFKKNANLLSDGTTDAEGYFWFCTGIGPGVIKQTDVNEIAFEPSGPSGTSVFGMTQSGNTLFTSAGGVSNTFGNAYNPAGFYIFDNNAWSSNPASTFNTGLYDYTFVYHNRVTGKNYVATHVNGLLEFKGKDAVNRWDAGNSTLQPTPVVNMVRASGISADEKGNLWVTNYGSPGAGLHMMNKAGQWTSIPISTSDVGNLIVDQNGYKWIQLIAGGILVYDDNKTPGNVLDDRSRTLNNRDGLITNEVTSLACDSNGYVWIGTTQGLNVFTNPMSVFDGANADRLIIRQNGVDGYLLGEESINDICVDGGNRKWFATNNGVFLVDANGQRVITQFRSENTPLPDNRVVCIGQQDKTGEVFFGTDKGIVSFRSDATAAGDKFGKLKIYPNPVKPGYSGLVTIEGLAEDSEIRITDATGNLVYQTQANGGTATWNGLRLNGTRPSSGVYFVFAVNKDGSETEMGRFVFMH
jgi:ligand-binding sensor domain-containing protein